MSDTAPGGQEPGRDPQAQLTRIDGELAQLRSEIDGLRGELRDAGPMDAVDRTSIMEQIEERVVGTARETVEQVKEKLDVRNLVAERPWTMLGVSVAAGFVAGSIGRSRARTRDLGYSDGRSRRARRRRERIESRAFQYEHSEDPYQHAGEDEDRDRDPRVQAQAERIGRIQRAGAGKRLVERPPPLHRHVHDRHVQSADRPDRGAPLCARRRVIHERPERQIADEYQE